MSDQERGKQSFCMAFVVVVFFYPGSRRLAKILYLHSN